MINGECKMNGLTNGESKMQSRKLKMKMNT